MYIPLDLASPVPSAAWPCYALLLILALTAFFYIIACADSSNGDETKADKKVAKKGATPTEPKIPAVATVSKFAAAGKTKKGNTVKPLGKLPLRLPKQLPTKKVIQTSDAVVSTGTSCSNSNKGKASAKASKLMMASSQASKQAPLEKSEKVAPFESSMSANSMVKGHTDSANSFARVEPRKTELLADSGSEEVLPSVIPAPDEL